MLLISLDLLPSFLFLMIMMMIVSTLLLLQAVSKQNACKIPSLSDRFARATRENSAIRPPALLPLPSLLKKSKELSSCLKTYSRILCSNAIHSLELTAAAAPSYSAGAGHSQEKFFFLMENQDFLIGLA